MISKQKHILKSVLVRLYGRIRQARARQGFWLEQGVRGAGYSEVKNERTRHFRSLERNSIFMRD